MHRLIALFALTAATLAFAVGPAGANEFSQSTLPTQGTYNPGAYNIAAVTITQNVSATIIAGMSVSCNSGFPNYYHTDNSYWRRFDLNGAHGIVSCFAPSRVDFGIEDAFSPNGIQSATVRLYTIPNASPLLLANLTLIGSFAVGVPNQSLTIFSTPVTATVVDPTLVDLVVEIFTPNGQAAGNRFFVGANNLGQTAPCYLSAADCGVPQPVTTASIGFPNAMFYMAVTGADCPTPSIAHTWGRLKSIYR